MFNHSTFTGSKVFGQLTDCQFYGKVWHVKFRNGLELVPRVEFAFCRYETGHHKAVKKKKNRLTKTETSIYLLFMPIMWTDETMINLFRDIGERRA